MRACRALCHDAPQHRQKPIAGRSAERLKGWVAPLVSALRGRMDGNALYYGDNMDILRKHIAEASVDLIYLDPPFSSNASYNVLFKAPSGK